MALNFSPRPIFPAHMPEENRVPGGGVTQEDIHDVLPDDPFGMDISSTVTAITGWLEDLGVSDYGVYGGGEEVCVDKGRCALLEELNLWLDTHMNIQPRVRWNVNDHTMSRIDSLGGFVMEEALEGSVNSGGGWSKYDNTMSKVDKLGGFFMEEALEGSVNSVVGWNKDDNTMSRVDRLDGFFMEEALKGSVNSGGGWNKDDNTMSRVNSLGGVVTKEVMERSGDSGGWNKDENTMFRVGSLDDLVMEEALEGSVDNGGGIGYGCFSTEYVVFDRGDGFVHENKNVLNSLGGTMFTCSRFDEFVSKVALGNFVDKDGVRHGCETMMDVTFGCGGIAVDGDKNKEAFGGITDEMDNASPHMGKFGEFVPEDSLGDFVDKGGVYHGCESMTDVMLGCSGIGVDGYKNKEAFGGVVDETEGGGSPHMGSRFGEFVSDDVLRHFVDKDGARHGCETMTDVTCGCGGLDVDGNKNTEAFGGIGHEMDDESPRMGNSFSEFVSEDGLGHFVDKDGVHHGCDVMFGCGGIDVDGCKNKEAFGGIADEMDDGSPHLSNRFGEFVPEDALEHFVDMDGVRHVCETTKDVMLGVGVNSNKNKEAFGGIADETDNASRHMGNKFREFAVEDSLGNFVDKGGVYHGCETMTDVMLACSGIGVDDYKNKEAFGGVDEIEDGGSAHTGSRFVEFLSDDALGHFVDQDGAHHGCKTMTDVMFGCSGIGVDGYKNKEAFGGIVDETDDGSPHMALSFALAYLDVRDLLSVERVCKSLRHTVQNDPLLWMNIQIGHPLNDRITDDDLLRLTNRAQGHLQWLNLVDCKVVTDEGLRRVLQNNPRMTKLGVPGCIKISTEGVMSCLRTYQLEAVNGINCIRIAGHAVTLEQYVELLLLLLFNKNVQPHRPKHYFFNRENIYIPLEDDRPIDLELCPKCEKLKLVYSCTAESCQAADQTTPSCRACISCIPRCEQCGRCIFNLPHVETFCLGFVCTDCSPDNGSSSFMHVVSSDEIDG
ncbi:hypothetical protein vseg_020081 [Gypsophila vaccaria]